MTKPGAKGDQVLGYHFDSNYGAESSSTLNLDNPPSYVVYHVRMQNNSGGARGCAYYVKGDDQTIISGAQTTTSNIYDNRSTKYTTFVSRSYSSGLGISDCFTASRLVAIN